MFDKNTPYYSFNTNVSTRFSSVNNTNICNAMIGGNTTYTLEEHLKQFRDDANYKILYECWQVEKKEYENRLKNVNMRYPTFSMHDATHSETILRQIAYFLGEDRIRQLSPTDTWLILESAYCHDIGMVLTATELLERLKAMDKEGFENVSKSMSSSTNEEVRMAWNYLEPFLRYINITKDVDGAFTKKVIVNQNIESYKTLRNLQMTYKSNWYEWPLHFTQAFMLLIEEWCRPKHAEDSAKKIKAEAEEKSYEGLIAHRLRYIIADIAVMHGAAREDILEKMDKSIQGHYMDYAHPRFVATLLRVGDLLDIDNNRFNMYQLAVAGNPSYTSFAHNLKHRALRDFLITPEQIKVKANFETADARTMLNDNVIMNIYGKKLSELGDTAFSEKVEELTLRAFKELSGWLKSLRQELEFFSVNWFSIVPPHLTGSCPVFKKEKLLLDGKEIDNDLTDLRYNITERRATEIIEGSGLYRDVFVSFIREILQNALDATKRRVYEGLKRTNKTKFSNPYEFYKYICNDLDSIIIDLDCQTDERDENIVFKIRDKGIGITNERLKYMQNIGDASDYSTSKQAEEMPKWWKPTGSFGIGMQTIFYFTKTFELVTRSIQDSQLRKMEFHSTQIGGKIDTLQINNVEAADTFGYGTELCIKMTRNDVRMQQISSSWGEISDIFADESFLFRSKIENTVHKIYGSFGIPINMNKNRGETPNLKGFMRQSFGKYFFCINSLDSRDKCCEVKSEDTISGSVSDIKKYEGFSCWDANRRILIRYRHTKEKYPELKIYFNEILVEDKAINDMINIPFFETEVYLFSDKAQNYLEINRDGFLYEKRRIIADDICSTHIDLMKILLKPNKVGKDTNIENACKYIWQTDLESDYYSNIRCYLDFLINGSREMFSEIGIDRFIQCNSIIRRLDDMADIDTNKLKSNNLWLIDSKNINASNIRIGSDELRYRYFIEDVMQNYTQLAITGMVCIRKFNRGYFTAYRTAKRSGNVMRVNAQSFRLYISKLYENIKSDENNRSCLVLPGKREYSEICVAKLDGNLGDTFEMRFDSAIIVPVAVDELCEWINKCKSEDEFLEKYKEYTSIKLGRYKKVVDYVVKHNINKTITPTRQRINAAYKRLMSMLWHAIKSSMERERKITHK